MSRRGVSVVVVMTLAFVFAPLVFGQTDPGVRGGPAGAGQPLASVAANNPAPILNFFNAGQDDFEEVEIVPDGLGPRFNSRSCGACHAQPATGGTAPALNPQIADATALGARNVIPSFITKTGPVREARFIFFTTNGQPDPNRPNGGVETLFTITGRSDAGPCSISQPSFANAVAQNNVIFRIPTPVFGSGLIDNIDDTTLLVNQDNQAGNNFGISGTFNHNGNDGTIARFGWKAQNKSLLIFSGEAYNVEMGVTNELFQQERPLPGEDTQLGLPANCKQNPTPEDHTHFAEDGPEQVSGAQAFVNFMRFLAPPTPSATVPGGSASINNGRALFNAVGCVVCHTATLRSSASSFTAGLSNVNANLFSDVEIHHMGTELADNVSQGQAGGDQFRTAPLWGLGQRIFFLHDGRTRNLLNAISAHNSKGSEANTSSFLFFNALSNGQKQDVLNFLRSL
ncbi:MAG: di-heme oxidoredictase family protein [Thermoanaerobaculia bacterium]